LADFDVIVAGAGPAGCATVISLAGFAPNLRVALVGGTRPAGPCIGETVPPTIRPILRHLGLWEDFVSAGFHASYRTMSAWGDGRLLSNEFLSHVQQVGWQLERERFDTLLITAAAARTQVTFAGTVQSARREGAGWELILRDGAACAARFIVDATGRSAALARCLGLRPISFDRLVGGSIHFAADATDRGELLVETFADGWWYTALLPGGYRVVTCMTDSDCVRVLGLRDRALFASQVARTRYVAAAAESCNVDPILWPANSRFISQSTNLPFLAIGDAASCFDPVSGQGIFKAMRSGVFASYAIADYLCRGDDRGLWRYGTFLTQEFQSFLSTLNGYYALERRWPHHPFWQRRHREMPYGRLPAIERAA
jgi:flavin-dependent dehydrogenase